ncbi:hypothetical protein FHR56_003446 [Xanthomonas sacchari]|uniref:hypothetical protein n=1 Tax=unclassified Xanthomonas TaxID=2643310 RepID=UPI00136E9405|nr:MULTISPECIES: hypothetical protein [unclassified Xanthomonas]MBB6368267.1 hypothetical protein [Xanthomonas sp. F10]MXV32175.1 hypothetical protein [Xanthomonas sp. LMG 8989]
MGVFTNGAFKFFSSASFALDSSWLSCDIALVGEAVDDRGEASIAAISGGASQVLKLRFDVDSQSFYVNGVATRFADFQAKLAPRAVILIDGTTMGFGEILQAVRFARANGCHELRFLYAEPKSYSASVPLQGHAQAIDHQLTTNCSFSTVQGFAQEYSSSRLCSHIFMLGFEPSRLLSAIEQRQFTDDTKRLFAVVGVPAFQAGWEAFSIRPHLDALADISIDENQIYYCQANSVREGYMTLWSLYRELGDENGCFYVSPLGTKPHSVAAALFLVETKGAEACTSLYYDHPERVKRRSKEVGQWHLVKVQLT